MEFFQQNDVAIEIGVFDQNQDPLDLSNLAYLSADILLCPDAGNILATSTLPASDIEALITTQNWLAGLDQNAVISFGQAQLAALPFVIEAGLTPKPWRFFWMVIHGITAAGEDIPLGAGWVRIVNAGYTTLNLPLYPPPTVIPAGCTYTIPAGVTITMTTPPEVFGNIVFGTDPTGRLAPGNLVIA